MKYNCNIETGCTTTTDKKMTRATPEVRSDKRKQREKEEKERKERKREK